MPSSEIPIDEVLIERLSDIQANLIKGIGWKQARYHFLRIEEPEQFGDALSAARPCFS